MDGVFGLTSERETGATVVGRVATQSVVAATPTAMIVDTVYTYDVSAMFDRAKPTRLTATESGWYTIRARATCGVQTIHRVIWIRINGAIYIARDDLITSASGSAGQTIATLTYLKTGDYVEMTVYHNTGTRTWTMDMSMTRIL